MKNKNLLFTFLLLIVSCLSVFAQDYILTPNHDCSVGYHDYTNSADNNYGYAIYYGSFSQPGYLGGVNAGMGLMSFDLSAIPPGTVITDARLDLFGCGPFGGGDAASVGDIGHNASYLERITQPWDEYTVTYNTRPHATPEHRVHLLWSTSIDEDYTNVDVTQLVQDMINDPDHSFGIRIRLRNGKPTRALAFWSRDGAPSEDLQPHLRITVEGLKNQVSQNSPQAVLNSNVFPNPFQSSAKIEFHNDYSNDHAELRVYNVFGQVVFTIDVSGKSSVEIVRGNLATGLYQFAIIRNNSIAEFGKFVIE